MPKRLRAISTSNYYLTSRSAASLSGLGTIDWTINLRYVSRGSEIYHGPIFQWSTTSSISVSTGYRLNILDNGIQLLKNGSTLAESWGTAPPIGGSENVLRIRGTASGWEISVNGVVRLTASDSSKVTSGYLGFACFNSETTIESFSGALSEDFESFAAGNLAENTTYGNWHIIGGGPPGAWSIEQHGAIDIVLDVLPASHTIATRTVGLYVDRLLSVSRAQHAVAGRTVGLYRDRLLTVNRATVSVATSTVGLSKEYYLSVSSAGVAVSGKIVALLADRVLQVDPASISIETGDVDMLVIEPTIYILEILPARILIESVPHSTDHVRNKDTLVSTIERKGRR